MTWFSNDTHLTCTWLHIRVLPFSIFAYGKKKKHIDLATNIAVPGNDHSIYTYYSIFSIANVMALILLSCPLLKFMRNFNMKSRIIHIQYWWEMGIKSRKKMRYWSIVWVQRLIKEALRNNHQKCSKLRKVSFLIPQILLRCIKVRIFFPGTKKKKKVQHQEISPWKI